MTTRKVLSNRLTVPSSDDVQVGESSEVAFSWTAHDPIGARPKPASQPRSGQLLGLPVIHSEQRSRRETLPQADFRRLIVRLETANGGHEVFDFAGRRGFAGFEVALNA
jgi:hypothetical protein